MIEFPKSARNVGWAKASSPAGSTFLIFRVAICYERSRVSTSWMAAKPAPPADQGSGVVCAIVSAGAFAGSGGTTLRTASSMSSPSASCPNIERCVSFGK